MAYSCGCEIALELAALLEEDGSIGIIILIDGSPDMLAEMIKRKCENEIGPSFEIKHFKTVFFLFCTNRNSTIYNGKHIFYFISGIN